MEVFIEQFENDKVGIATPSGPVDIVNGYGTCTEEQFPILERMYGAVIESEEDSGGDLDDGDDAESDEVVDDSNDATDVNCDDGQPDGGESEEVVDPETPEVVADAADVAGVEEEVTGESEEVAEVPEEPKKTTKGNQKK